MEDLITVIVTTYNDEKYIQECLESIIKQTYNNLQIIIVNDGSTDKTLDICKMFQKKDSRIEIINKENGGPSSARNLGIKYIRGKYFLFVDADDVIDLRTVEILSMILIENDVKISICGYEKFYKDYFICQYNKNLTEIKSSEEYFKDILCFKKDTYAWGTLISSEFSNIITFPEGKYFEDLATMYKLYSVVEKIAFNPVELVKYRQVEDSIVHQFKQEKVDDYIYFSDVMCKNIQIQYKDTTNLCKQYMANAYISAIYLLLDNSNNLTMYKKNLKIILNNVKIENVSLKIRMKLMLFKLSVDLGIDILRLKKRRTKI